MDNALTFLANKLQALGHGTVGTDIYIGQLPAEKNGIYLVRIGGTMENYLPIQETLIDVHVQNIKSREAIDLIQDIKNDLHRHLETGDNNTFVYTILAIGDIEDLGRDIDYGKIYKITLQLTHRATALIS